MRPIIEWLRNVLSRETKQVELPKAPVPAPVSVRVRPGKIADDEYTVEFNCGIEVPDSVATTETGRDNSTPELYLCDDESAQRQIDILNDSPLDAAEPVGVDPYNTGRFDSSRAWNSPSTK